MSDTIAVEIKAFMTENFLFGQEDERLAGDQSFLQAGIIDSTGLLELVGFIEERYGITVDDHELLPEHLDSLTSVSQFVARKQGLAAPVIS